MSNFKKVVYGLLSVLGMVAFVWAFLPVTAGVLQRGMLIVALVGLCTSIYSLLSLKYPKDEIPFKDQQDAEYKVKMALKRQEILNAEDPKLRGTVLFGMKNVDLDAFDKKIEDYDVPGLVVSRETREKIDKVVIAALVIFVAIFGILSFRAATGNEKYDGKYNGQTVVVMSGSISGDRPSQQVENRLLTAADILKENPEAKVVVTGGQGLRDIKARCQVMSDYLTIEKGIAADRIYQVNSDNDEEAIFKGVKELAEENNLNKNLIVVTEAGNQKAAQKAAQAEGLKATGANTETEMWMWFAVWCNAIL